MKKWILLGIMGVGIGIWFSVSTRPTIQNEQRPVQVIVAFGNSLTSGKGAGGRSLSYPAVLAELTGLEVINLGVSGELAVQAPARLPEVLAYGPDMVLIEFGANDYMQHLSMDDAVDAVEEIVDAVQKSGAIAVIVDTGGPGMEDYTKAYKKLAKEKGAIFVPGILKGIFRKRELKSDMVHPNAAGYEIIAERVYEAIEPYL